MIDKAALKQVLEDQIANPGSNIEFLRQLRQLVVENHSVIYKISKAYPADNYQDLCYNKSIKILKKDRPKLVYHSPQM